MIIHRYITAFTISMLMASSLYAASETDKGSKPNGKPFVAIDNQIVEIQGAVSSLEDQVEELVGRVDSIEERVAANETAISDLENENGVLQTLINQNATDIASINTLITALQEENIGIKTDIANNAGDIAQLEADLAANNALISTLQSALLDLSTQLTGSVADLQSQINQNNDLIALLQQDITTINNLLGQKQDILDGQCPAGMALQEIQADGTISCISAGDDASTTFIKMRRTVGIGGNSYNTGNTMTCPLGYWATSGGFYKPRGVEVIESQQYFASNGTGWWWSFYNTNSYSTSVHIGMSCFKF